MRTPLLRLLGFMIVFHAFSLALADIPMKVDLELKIQNKLLSLIRSADPYAQVVVNVRMKKFTVDLPGTGTGVVGMFSNSGPDGLSFDDIDKVSVTVVSVLDPFPASLKKMMESSLDFPSGKWTLSVDKMDKQVAELVKSQENRVQHNSKSLTVEIERFSTRWEKFIDQFLTLCVGAFSTLVAFFFISMWRTKRNFESAVNKLVEHLGAQGAGSASREIIDLPRASQAQLPSGQPGQSQLTGSDSSGSSVRALPGESLLALLSDCYWCEEDEYAAWLWNQISPEQRIETIERWPTASEYVRSLAKTTGKGAGFHNHPYYLRPLPIFDMSQEDLASWLRKSPGIWHFISPLRQAKARLSLREKMTFSNAAPFAQLPPVPSATSSRRSLNRVLSVGVITEQDELALLENPDMVPVDLRSTVPSLVWVALMKKEDREALLAQLSAQFLAQAWIAPGAVLEKLDEVLTDKKRTLLREYAKRVAPSRDSDAMSYLVTEALKSLSAEGQGKEDDSHAKAA